MSQYPTSSRALFRLIQQRLSGITHAAEAEQQAYWLLEALFGKNRTDVILDKPLEMGVEERGNLEAVLERLERHEPIQYVLGEAPFYGYEFKVSPAVLIPRPETEELVQLICGRHAGQQGLQLLDIGTGSGCIAISLALCLPGAQVSALDISAPALEVAMENARRLQARVRFFKRDILKEYPEELPLLDVIVSNPPYVREQEKRLMKPNVMEWEPHTALFVKDTDPLLFYRRISRLAMQQLKPGGFLYFEINEAYGKQVAEMVEVLGFQGVAVLPDMQGKDRMLQAQKPATSS